MLRLVRFFNNFFKNIYVGLYFKMRHPYIYKEKKKYYIKQLLVKNKPITYNDLIINLFSPSTYFSEFGQDYYLSSLLLNYVSNSKGINWIVDIGAGEPEFLSNSMYFEKYYGCKTLAVDVVEEFHKEWMDVRPDAIFVSSAVGKEECDVKIAIPRQESKMLSCVKYSESKVDDTHYLERNVPMRTLTGLLDEYDIKEILMLSIDVSGNEFEVLKGLNFKNVKIKSIVLKNRVNKIVGEEAPRLFLKHRNFVFVARLGDSDDVYLHQSLINGIPYWMN